MLSVMLNFLHILQPRQQRQHIEYRNSMSNQLLSIMLDLKRVAKMQNHVAFLTAFCHLGKSATFHEKQCYLC